MLRLRLVFTALWALTVTLPGQLASAQEASGPADATAVTGPADISPTFDTPAYADAVPSRRDRRPAETGEQPDKQPGWHAELNLAQRLVADGVSPVESQGPLATDALRSSSPAQLEYRSRTGGRLSWHGDQFVRELEARLELEIRTWDRPDPALQDGATLLRRGGAELTTSIGRFSLGRMTTTWGLGAVAQDGTDDAMQFGVRRGGNVVTRMGYAFLPAALFQSGDPQQAFPLAIAVAYDWVVRDDLAYFPGDSAHNAILALVYQGKALQAGLYGVMRDQKDALGLGLNARMADAFFRWRQQGQRDGWVGVSAEGAAIGGTTGWLKTIDHKDGLDIAQLGGVARLEFGLRRWSARIETGVAGADPRPLDGTLRTFRFAADYHVGLVMFAQAQRQLAERAAANLSDPLYVQNAPAGVERLRTEGAVTQAVYLHPVWRAEVGRHVAVLLGGLWAHAPTDVADPFRTWLAGGKATGPRGGTGSRDLGTEFDGAIEAHGNLGPWLRAGLRFDAGVWLPGAAFDDAQGRPMAAVGAWQGSVQLKADL